ncbi:MAG: Txe/YoeB family addiction module toxin [Ignavibacteriaceae bacterium]|nr:Txe/YoeB family addiction module toxin [Ignavibacteriaceae bacterium]
MKSKNPKERLSIFHQEFRDDLAYWVKTDRKTALRILEIIEAIMRDPFEGIGKPEPLRYLGSGVWSRRITQEHRIVYVVGDGKIDFVQCRYHY